MILFTRSLTILVVEDPVHFGPEHLALVVEEVVVEALDLRYPTAKQLFVLGKERDAQHLHQRELL